MPAGISARRGAPVAPERWVRTYLLHMPGARLRPSSDLLTGLTLESLGPQLAQTPVEDACEVSVIMPVKDEAGRLVRALTALASQTQTDGRPFARHRYEVLVLANNCRDESAALARMVGRQHPEFRLRVLEVELQGDQACVGFARRLLMDEACRRQLSRPDPAGVIASTDGDTVVAPTSLAATLDEFNRGADAVGGRIQTDPVERAALD